MSGFPHSTMYLCHITGIFDTQYLWTGLMKIPRYTVFTVYRPALTSILWEFLKWIRDQKKEIAKSSETREVAYICRYRSCLHPSNCSCTACLSHILINFAVFLVTPLHHCLSQIEMREILCMYSLIIRHSYVYLWKNPCQTMLPLMMEACWINISWLGIYSFAYTVICNQLSAVLAQF